MPKIGDINLLKVLRKTDIGFMLDSDDEEIFLHNNESMRRDLKPDEIVEAFLYYDEKSRLAATLHTPYITVETTDFVEVIDVHEKLGVFLDMGINKDLLLSMDELPTNKAQWPQVGDKIYATVFLKGRLVAKIVQPAHDEEQEFELGQMVEGYVQNIGEVGLNITTTNLKTIFVHESMFRGMYRVGQKVEVRVTHFSELGYSGSLMPQKEILRLDDAGIILDYLQKNGSLPLTSKSRANEIAKYFEMSRKAFKRALGHLYRERKVTFTDDKTILVGEKDE